MTTAVEHKKYKDLLDVLAQFLKLEAEPMTIEDFIDCCAVSAGNLDSFLDGYAGIDWRAAKARAQGN
jgi:hypothetical protein